MKKLSLLLCLIILLTGCQVSTADTERSAEADKSPIVESTNESANVSVDENTDESDVIAEEPDPLTLIRESLSQDCSFSVEEMYMELASFGFSQNISQENATDGSFHFTMESHQWNHPSEYDAQSTTEYYYQYEDGTLVCYIRTNGGEPNRHPMSKEEEIGLFASKEQLIGTNGLLPDYMTDFTDEGIQSDTGLHCYSFRLSLSDILTDQTLLSSYISSVCAMCGATDLALDQLHVTATIFTDDNMRPVKLTHDFSELKPYVLSEGALSGEFALDTDLMYLTYEFDYDMPQSIPVPDDFIPAS